MSIAFHPHQSAIPPWLSVVLHLVVFMLPVEATEPMRRSRCDGARERRCRNRAGVDADANADRSIWYVVAVVVSSVVVVVVVVVVASN